ncbi:Sodium channel protein Nach [Penaeus vannamei]|uniref:Sodium channel protein Nach n=1 Tax=Penaeus vannamei TaxID=6689 RepID=A0A3R7MPJ9_PENVA|nr:Sodium channel protein Nach [Penaeus vannamei]
MANSGAKRVRKIGKYSFEYDKDFIQERSFLELSELLCQESTAHGIGHAWNNRHNALGIFWLVATICFGLYLGVVATQLFVDFSRREVESQTTVLLSRDGLELPSVLICNRSFFSKKKLEAMNISRDLSNYLVALTGTPYLLRESFLGSDLGKEFLFASDAEVQTLLRKHSMTRYSQLIDAISYDCEELVLKCSVGPYVLSKTECCAGFSIQPSMAGRCFQYFNDGTYRQTIDGEYMGITVYFSVPDNDTPEVAPGILNLSGFTKTGLQVSFASNHTHPSFLAVGQGVHVTPAHSTFIDLSLSVVKDIGMKTMFDPGEEECLPMDRISYKQNKQDFFYTDPNCDLGLFRQCFLALCNCTLYGLDYPEDSPYPQCNLAQTGKCYNYVLDKLELTPSNLANEDRSTEHEKIVDSCWDKGSIKCNRPCVRYDYSYTSSKSRLDDNVYQALKEQFNVSNDSSVAIIKAYFPALRNTEIKLWRTGIEDLIGKLGGYSGLFLGASLITLEGQRDLPPQRHAPVYSAGETRVVVPG